LRCDRLGAALHLQALWVKDETRQPTGSFKDRPLSVAVSKAREFGRTTVVTASSGNAAASMSAYAARAGLRAVVFEGHIRSYSMDANELRRLQAPLKERYREAPMDALVTLRAEGRVGEGVTCKVKTGKAAVVAGLHPATGGTGLAACSGDMLLEALVACAGVTLNAVATALGIELRDAVVQAEGDLDFRGTLGASKEVPVGFQRIRLRFTLDTDASAEQQEKLLRLTERYCVVYQTLARPPDLTATADVANRRAG
jgi:uncharacterized OsmC-like protein